MLVVTEVLCCTALTLLLVYILKIRRARLSRPPGPLPLPIIGNLYNIIQDGGILEFYQKQQEKYGNVYSIELAGVKYAVISGYENLRLLLIKHGRSTYRRNIELMPPSYDILNMRERPGIMFDPDTEMRQHTVRLLKEEGIGTADMEVKVQEEADKMCSHFIEPHLDSKVSLSTSLHQTTSNVIFSIIVGHRFEYDSPQLVNVNERMKVLFESNMAAIASKNIPFASFFPSDPFQHKVNCESLKEVLEYFDRIVADRRELLRTNSSTGSFVDKFLLHFSNKDQLTQKQLDSTTAATLMQMFGGGTDTTAYTLHWAILFLCLYPDVQRKMQKEIDSVFGDKIPTYSDRAKLPYIEAVILETLRCSMVLPTLLPHTLDEAVVVEGQTIPASTELIFNLQSIYNDEKVFQKPDLFNPERFLTGDIQMKKTYVGVSFGVGKRSCPGEALAKMELFIFLSSLLQRYSVRHAGINPPPSKGTCGSFHIPPSFPTIWTSRR